MKDLSKERFSMSSVFIQRVRVRFSRLGDAIYLTHLQYIEGVRRALLLSGWPLTMTQGKRPIVKASFGPAISVGVESLAEYCDVQLSARIDLTKAKDQISPHLPAGYAVTDVKSIPRFFPSLEQITNAAEFFVRSDLLTDTKLRWEEFWASQSFPVVKKKQDRQEIIDARPLVKSWTLEGRDLILQLRFGPGRTLKPERVIQAVCGFSEEDIQMGNPAAKFLICRTHLYFEKTDGTLLEP